MKKNQKNFEKFRKIMDMTKNLTKKNKKKRDYSINAISGILAMRVLEETMRVLVKAMKELIESIRGPEKSDFEN